MCSIYKSIIKLLVLFLFLSLYSWFIFKHSKPLPQDIVRFTPYADSGDHYRGTTVLPYLEAFYQYGVEGGMDRGATATGVCQQASVHTVCHSLHVI